MVTPLISPVGHYNPELLVLAPEEDPDDPNLRSLVSQLLELGIPFELDEHWRVPRTPPRDLSAYKACLFPETARAKYDKDLDVYYSRGGYLIFDKYYPVSFQTAKTGFTGGTAAYLYGAWGRDLYFYSIANSLLESGVTLDNPDFRQTFERRPVGPMLDECRNFFMTRCQASKGPWRSWGDPTYTTFLANLDAGKKLGDKDWLGLLDGCLRRVCEAAPEALANPLGFQEIQLKGAAANSFELMGQILMKRGSETGEKEFVHTGIRLARYYTENVFETRGDKIIDRRGFLLYNGEALTGLPSLFWLTRCTGESAHAELAGRLVREVCQETQRSDGLWHHWKDLLGGRQGLPWSRAQMWPMLFFCEALEAAAPASEAAQLMRTSIQQTFAALSRTQDPEWGLWHLIVDEPESRIESSAAANILYCHDHLRQMGILDSRYDEMAERALRGLKRLYYRGGLGASCRGTACGVPNYYRSRPMGYYNSGLFPAALANYRLSGT